MAPTLGFIVMWMSPDGRLILVAPARAMLPMLTIQGVSGYFDRGLLGGLIAELQFEAHGIEVLSAILQLLNEFVN